MATVQTHNNTVSTKPLGDVKWPTNPLVTLESLEAALQFLGTDEDRGKGQLEGSWTAETLPSMQVIRSGAQAITKTLVKAVGAAGGIGASVAAVGGGLSAGLDGVNQPLTIALIAATAFILASASIALALLVKGDLQSRGIATAARYTGRAEVAAMFLAVSTDRAHPAAKSTRISDGELMSLISRGRTPDVATRVNPQYQPLTGRYSHEDGVVRFQMVNGDWVTVADVVGYRA